MGVEAILSGNLKPIKWNQFKWSVFHHHRWKSSDVKTHSLTVNISHSIARTKETKHEKGKRFKVATAVGRIYYIS